MHWSSSAYCQGLATDIYVQCPNYYQQQETEVWILLWVGQWSVFKLTCAFLVHLISADHLTIWPDTSAVGHWPLGQVSSALLIVPLNLISS